MTRFNIQWTANTLSMETQFGIELEDEVILYLKSVGDVVKYIDSHQ